MDNKNEFNVNLKVAIAICTAYILLLGIIIFCWVNYLSINKRIDKVEQSIQNTISQKINLNEDVNEYEKCTEFDDEDNNKDEENNIEPLPLNKNSENEVGDNILSDEYIMTEIQRGGYRGRDFWHYESRYFKISDGLYYIKVKYDTYIIGEHKVFFVSYLASGKDKKSIFKSLSKTEYDYDVYIDCDKKILKHEINNEDTCETVFFDISDGEFEKIDDEENIKSDVYDFVKFEDKAILIDNTFND